MTSFISTLSLLVLVLATGCFTLPVTEEPFSSSTYSSLIDDLTTDKNNEMGTVNTRLVPDEETTESLKVHSERLLNEKSDVETSSRFLSEELEENTSRALHTFNDLSTLEPLELTTENSVSDIEHDERDSDDSLFTTAESVTEVNEHRLRNVTSEDETEDYHDKREPQLELTTSYMPSFTSTSSAVAPQLYTSESSTSTEIYIGLLKDETDEEKEPKKDVKIGRKPISKHKVSTTTKKTKDSSEEDSKELNVAVAQLDQQALDQVSNVPSEILILEETVEIFTVLPENLSTTTIKDDNEHEHEHEREDERKPEPERERRPLSKPGRIPKPELEGDDELKPKPEPIRERRPTLKLESEPEREDKPPKPLNQGKKPSLPEEKESDH